MTKNAPRDAHLREEETCRKRLSEAPECAKAHSFFKRRTTMDAIIYTTNTGSTEQYAKLLAQKTGLPTYSLAEAKKRDFVGAEAIYLGWIMAGSVKAMPRLRRTIGCAPSAASVWDKPEHRQKACGKKSAIPANIPLFTLQRKF